jgi:hypothetical protein
VKSDVKKMPITTFKKIAKEQNNIRKNKPIYCIDCNTNSVVMKYINETIIIPKGTYKQYDYKTI